MKPYLGENHPSPALGFKKDVISKAMVTIQAVYGKPVFLWKQTRLSNGEIQPALLQETQIDGDVKMMEKREREREKKLRISSSARSITPQFADTRVNSSVAT